VLLAGLAFSHSAAAQEVAAVQWPLTETNRIGAVETGDVSGTAALEVDLRHRDFSGPTGPLGERMQRWRNEAENWPGNETEYVPTRYLQFAATAPAGFTFEVTEIRMALSKGGTNDMWAAIAYSTNSDFSDAVFLETKAELQRDNVEPFYSTHEYAISVALAGGETIYLRVFPFTSASGTGRNFIAQDVRIVGTTEAASGPELPTVTTAEVTAIFSTSATAGGEVIGDGGAEVTSRGIVWSTTEQPTLDDNIVTAGAGTGEFIAEMTDLSPGETYFVRAFATNAIGTSFGEQVSFTTALETVHYWHFNDGAAEVPRFPQPFPANIGSGTLTYTLDPAFIADFQGTELNAEPGIAMGGSFSPQGGDDTINNGRYLQLHAPTTGYENILISYATRGTGTGFSTHTVEYSIDGETFLPFEIREANRTATWRVDVLDFSDTEGVDDNPNFRVRITLAGATGASGNNRFDNLKVTGLALDAVEPQLPVVATTEVTQITATSATVGGEVIDDGGAEVTSRGVVWSTSPEPTLADERVDAAEAGTGAFSVQLTGLQPDTRYYVRAFATNEAGTAFGDQVEFRTEEELPEDGAVARWPLTQATGTAVEVVGEITAAAASAEGGLEIRRYRDVTGPLGVPMSEWWLNADWPVETAYDPDRFVQFAVSPAADHRFTAERIRFAIGSTGTNNMWAAVYVSTDPDFAEATQLFDGDTPRDGYEEHDYEVDLTARGGGTVYLRIHPYTDAGGPGRHLLLQDVRISGTTASAVSVEDQMVPTEFRLHANYPNPFNPSTVIRYDLPVQGHVHLSVYDLTGRRVAMLVDETVAAGTHQVTWDATGIASGVYIYRIETAGYVATHRMTLVK
jgi:hypothetical protein